MAASTRQFRLTNHPGWVRYGFAVLLSAAALALTALVEPVIGTLPYFFVYPAFFIVVTVAGFGPAVLSIAACGLGADYFFTEPRYGFFDNPAEAFRLVLFGAMTLATAALIRNNRIAEKRRAERLAAQREAEHRFRIMADTAPVLIWMADTSKGCVYFNESWLEYTGRTLEQEVGDGWTEGVHPDDFDRCLRVYHAAFEARQTFSMEYRLRHHGGQYRWILDRGVPRYEEGRFAGYIGACIDIHDQHTLQERFRVAQDLSLDAFTILNADRDARGRIVDFTWDYVNPQAARVLKHPADWLVGKRLLEVLPGNRDRSELFRLYCEVVATGAPHDVELHYVDGAIEGWFRNMAVKVGDGVAVYFSDITQRKQYEKELEEAKARFEAVANQIPQLAWMTDAAGNILWYNQQWFNYTGTTLDQMQREGWTNVHHPEHTARVTENWVGHLETGEPWEDTFPLRGADGSFRWFLSRARPIRNRAGRIVTWFGTNTDIEDQRRAQAELEALAVQLRQAVEARDNFLSIASHELRTPLTSLTLYHQIMKRGIEKGDPGMYSKDRVERLVAQSEQQAARLRRLIDDMLDVSRIAAGRLTLQRERFDLCELVREVAGRMEHEFVAATGAPLAVDPCDDAHGFWDRVRLDQVATNLFTNALRYGGGNPVEASVRREGDEVVLAVTDRGIGVAKEDQAKIFDRFERAVTPSAASGLGLGLYITRQIVEAHGGRIWVESEPEKGSTFFVALGLKQD